MTGMAHRPASRDGRRRDRPSDALSPRLAFSSLILGALAIILGAATSFDGTIEVGSILLCVAALTGMVLSSLYGNTLLAFFNSVCMFLVVYPYLLQYGNGLNLSGYGELSRLDWRAGLGYGIFILIVTAIGLTARKRRPEEQTIYVRSGFRAGFTSVAISVVFVALFGMSRVIGNRTDISTEAEAIEGVMVFLSDTLKLIPFWLAYGCMCWNFHKGRRLVNTGVIVSAIVGLVICNPLNSPRFISLSAIVLLAIPYLTRYRLMKYAPLLFPLLMIVVLPITSQLRYGLDDFSLHSVMRVFYSSEFSSLQVLNDGYRVLDLSSWGYGHYILSGLLVFIPRSWWPGKNDGTGFAIGSNAGYAESNVGVPPHFEFYLDFGWIGILAFAVAVGLIYRYLVRASQNGKTIGLFHADMFALCFATMPIFIRGDLATAMIGIYSFVVAYGLSRLVFFKRVR